MKSLAIACQFSCIFAVNSLPMSEKGLTMGRMLVLTVMLVGIIGNSCYGSRLFLCFQ